jgi:Transposase DDE domain
MPATPALYQAVVQQIKTASAPAGVRQSSVVRLALLVCGIVAAQTCVLARVADEVEALALTDAAHASSIGRRLRRTLNDPALTAANCYTPAVRAVVAASLAASRVREVVLIVDESTHTDRIHLLRVSLAYRGGSVPLAWALWPQNVRQAPGQYWQAIEQVLTTVAALLPADRRVVVVADRAYDVPAFVDAVARRGWGWIVRVKAESELRVRDRRGQEQAIHTLVQRHLARPGQRWRLRGQVFKTAGWRRATLVGLWARDQAEPLVLLTNRAPRRAVARTYRQRFWTEPGFRQDKRAGWQWEASQVRDVAHQERLVLALAWATLLTVCVGAEVAEERLAQEAAKPPHPMGAQPPRQRPHARQSLFTLGLRRLRRWLYRGVAQVRWLLPGLHCPSWTRQWEVLLLSRYSKPVRP